MSAFLEAFPERKAWKRATIMGAAKRLMNDDRIVDRIAEHMKVVLSARYPEMFDGDRT